MPEIVMEIDATAPHLKELRGLLRQFKQIDLTDYDPRVLGDRTFRDSYLYSLAEQFKLLGECELYFLPRQDIQRLTDFAARALELFKASAEKNLSKEQQDKIVESSEALYDESAAPVTWAIAYSKVRSLDVRESQEEASRLIQELEKKRAEAETILRNIKEAAQKKTVGQEAIHFNDEAKKHKMAAYGWLAVTIFIALATFGFAWDSYSFSKQLFSFADAQASSSTAISTAQSIQYGVAKLILFSLLIGGLVWCGRIYRAHRHNYVVNKHRVNALGSFNTFVSSTQDQQTKNAVLLQATQCIYTAQPSGYISQDSETGGYPPVLELLKTAVDTKK